jgi:hypothetical protein
MPRGACLLCRRDGDLQLSHVLPGFVFRWLRESSAGAFLRSGTAPNRRVQDGEKRYWLCAECEQLFGGWEKSFAERLFFPFIQSPATSFTYAKWLMGFCASVSWRVLHFVLENDGLADWPQEARQRVSKAEDAWREYLLGLRRRPGEFQQHLLPVDSPDAAVLGPFANRYFMRAVAADILRGQRCILTFAKIGRFVILGFVHEPNLQRWKGTRVEPVSGMVKPRDYTVPESLLRYFAEKAQEGHDMLSGLSPRQKKNIASSIRGNLAKYTGSDAFRAMHADVQMFGEDAFTSRERDAATDDED